jgi:hypothetical protein
MSKLINLSIDVTKIDKSKLIQGKKGTYLNLTVAVNDEADQFGNNVSAWIGQSKEEREAKNDRTFLGNGKVVFSSDAKKQKDPISDVFGDDDLAF